MSSGLKKPVKLIVCIYPDGIIGINNSLPIRIDEDISFFKNITSKTSDPDKKNAVIMGFNTYQSIPTKHFPLKNRYNIVLSTTQEMPVFFNTQLMRNFYDALDFCNSDDSIEQIFIIGGYYLYRFCLDPSPSSLKSEYNNLIDEMYITHIQTPALNYTDDDTLTTFPMDLINLSEWNVENIQEIKSQGFLFKEKIYKDVSGFIKHYIRCHT